LLAIMTEVVSPCLRSRMILPFLGDVPRAVKLTPAEDIFHEIIPAATSAWIRRGGTDDHLLDRPLESLDAVRNTATMKDVLGWSNQQEAAISARAK
jgi:hypothetical protein